jgi:hypothetical protein
MSDQATPNVQAAFATLMQTVASELASINAEGIKAFEARRYDQARFVAERAEKLNGFESRLTILRDEWGDLLTGESAAKAASSAPPAQPGQQGGPAAGGQSAAGKAIWQRQTTPEDRFYHPILDAVIEAGGAAREEDILNPVDLNPVPNGDPQVPVWRITSLWARGSLVQSGLMKVDSKKKTWEITDKGRAVAAQKEPVQVG